jgi:hypothetical protein
MAICARVLVGGCRAGRPGLPLPRTCPCGTGAAERRRGLTAAYAEGHAALQQFREDDR